jgi:hypothetical protein
MHMVQTASNHSSHSSTGTATIVWCLSRCHCSTDHPIMCLSMPFSCLICRLTNKIIDISSQLSLARTTHLMCVCTYMCVYMYVCMYVCIYIYIYIGWLAHICVSKQRANSTHFCVLERHVFTCDHVVKGESAVCAPDAENVAKDIHGSNACTYVICLQRMSAVPNQVTLHTHNEGPFSLKRLGSYYWNSVLQM